MKARYSVWAACIGVAVCMTAAAADLRIPTIPAKDAAKVFPDAPAPWHDYLAKARAAERITDPLQRCLAFPDMPGNHWPAGHAAAHCAFHAMQNAPAITLDEIDGYLARGDTQGLRTRLDGYLARHYAEGVVREDIDVVFDQFDAEERSDTLSKTWLQLAPDDPYANLARANHLRWKAGMVRGDEYVADTPNGNLENMRALVDRAIPLFERASKLEPRLLPAYVGLMEVANLTGRDELGETAFAAAQALDPTCLYVVRERLRSLKPRWGGSYPQMLAYMEELTPHLREHPAIAIYFPVVYEDRLQYIEGDDLYKAPAASFMDQAVDIGSYDEALHSAGDIALHRKDAPIEVWRGLALLLQEARFKYGSAGANRNIAFYLVRTEPEWALQYIARSYQQEPDDSELQYVLGAALYNTHRYAEAQKHYNEAIKDPAYRQASLRESSTMWLYGAGLERKAAATKARPFVDRLLREYPKDGRGWIYRLNIKGALESRLDLGDVKKFLAVADRGDPVQAQSIGYYEDLLRKFPQAAK